MQVSIAYLIGNPTWDDAENRDADRDDARTGPVLPSGALPEEIRIEMDSAFGYGRQDDGPTLDEWDRMYAEWRADSDRNERAAKSA